MKRAIAFTSVFVAVAFLPASATVINVPGDYPTIQEGIDASSDGDTVLVADGTYTGDGNREIDFGGRAIVVMSENGPEVTIIDCEGAGRGFYFFGGEDSTSVLQGFTITNGSALSGGGIYNYSSSPTVTNCTFTGNSADSRGGGMWIENSSATITNCTFAGNSAYYRGGGMWIEYSSPTVTNCTFSGNEARYGGGMYNSDSSPLVTNCMFIENSAGYYDGGGIYNSYSDPTVTNCTFSGNSATGDWSEGGGMNNYYSSPTVTNCTFSGNEASYGGGMNNDSAILTVTNCTFIGNSADWGGGMNNYYSSPTVTNCILWDDLGGEIYNYGSSPIVTYSDVEGGYTGEGNINEDPLFRDPENGDFHLMADSCGDVYNSPCIDAGDPVIFDSMLGCDWGLGELRSDMGAYGGAGIPTNVDEEQIPEIPMQFLLSQNYPNPFNASTVIKYTLPQASDVTVDIFDLLGRRVETLMQGEQQAGYNQIIWNADDKSSGMYFYRIQAGDYAETKKMVLLK